MISNVMKNIQAEVSGLVYCSCCFFVASAECFAKDHDL